MRSRGGREIPYKGKSLVRGNPLWEEIPYKGKSCIRGNSLLRTKRKSLMRGDLRGPRRWGPGPRRRLASCRSGGHRRGAPTTIVYYTILYYTMIHYTYYTIPHYTILHYTILYYSNYMITSGGCRLGAPTRVLLLLLLSGGYIALATPRRL